MDLLLEIGTEEIPAADLDQAMEQLYVAFVELKQEQHFDFDEKKIEVMGTPRRLAVYVRDFPSKQDDIVSDKVKGPPVAAAFRGGKPTQAATGFAKAQGIKLSDLTTEKTDKGEYVFAVRTKPGLPSKKVLTQALPQVLASIEFKKSMRWKDSVRFIRPIRWLVALLGNEVVPFRYAGLKASNKTYGHRLLANKEFVIKNASVYKKVMKDAHVVVEPQKRARSIEKHFGTLNEGIVDVDNPRVQKTFCEVINLVENPGVIIGQFEKKFLKLPPIVIETVLQSHQRYFPILNKTKSKLTNNFLVVQNGSAKNKSVIKRGHEKVVNARLEDGEFFVAEDKKRTLSSRVKELRGIVFHEGLGNLLDKTKRLQFIVKKIATDLSLSKKRTEDVSRAAYLAKADLLTSMVAEFDELQGAIGAQYAENEGESKEVIAAIREQYQPRSASDTTPKSQAGIILAIADRIDTLCAYVSKGIVPTSTGDPYALRRQATGLVDILFESGLELSIPWLTKISYKRLAKDFSKIDDLDSVVSKVFELVNQRIEFLLLKTGIDYDIIRSVAALRVERPVEFRHRSFALQSIRNNSPTILQDLVTVYNRAFRIADRKQGTTVNKSLLVDSAEIALYKELMGTEKKVDKLAAANDFLSALKELAAMRKTVDIFFDEVLVMAKEKSLKRNRHALLNRFVDTCLKVADLSKIVKSN